MFFSPFSARRKIAFTNISEDFAYQPIRFKKNVKNVNTISTQHLTNLLLRCWLASWSLAAAAKHHQLKLNFFLTSFKNKKKMRER